MKTCATDPGFTIHTRNNRLHQQSSRQPPPVRPSSPLPSPTVPLDRRQHARWSRSLLPSPIPSTPIPHTCGPTSWLWASSAAPPWRSRGRGRRVLPPLKFRAIHQQLDVAGMRPDSRSHQPEVWFPLPSLLSSLFFLNKMLVVR
jgi:hypothetical protein